MPDVRPAATRRQPDRRPGRVFLHSDDIEADHRHMQAHGVHFAEAPRDEAFGRVAVFLDLCDNRWNPLQPR